MFTLKLCNKKDRSLCSLRTKGPAHKHIRAHPDDARNYAPVPEVKSNDVEADV